MNDIFKQKEHFKKTVAKYDKTLVKKKLTDKKLMQDFYDITNAEVLFIGVLLLLVAIIIRTYVEGFTWIKWYMPKALYVKNFSIDKKSHFSLRLDVPGLRADATVLIPDGFKFCSKNWFNGQC